MGHISPKDILRYHKWSYPPRFSTLEEPTKEDPWGVIWKIRILGQSKSLEAGKYLLTTNDITSPIPTNLEEVGKYAVGDKLTGEYMANLWSTEDLLVRDEVEILVWHHMLNQCSFKCLLRIPKMGIITRNLINITTPTPCVTCLFDKSHNSPRRTKCKHSGRSIRKPLETIPGDMT